MIKRGIKYVKYRINRIFSSLGSMQEYYKRAWAYDEKMKALVDASKEKKRVVQYAKVVSGKPFEKEKEIEKRAIWQAINGGQLEKEFPKEVEYIKKKNELMLYPYEFSENYTVTEDMVFDDVSKGLCYVYHKGFKLYFPMESHREIAYKYYQLVMEQDVSSPHRYFAHEVPECDVFVDIGAAEGIISLEAVNKAEEIYLMECSEKWNKALLETFSQWSNKVHIIRKYVGDCCDENTITLDSLLSKYENKKIVLKMDIEGMELEALKGASKCLKENDCVLSCATYHRNDAHDEIKEFLETNLYCCETTPNYMLFIYGYMTLHNGKYQKMEYPYFRHGIIRATKEK